MKFQTAIHITIAFAFHMIIAPIRPIIKVKLNRRGNPETRIVATYGNSFSVQGVKKNVRLPSMTIGRFP